MKQINIPISEETYEYLKRFSLQSGIPACIIARLYIRQGIAKLLRSEARKSEAG